MVLSHGGDWGNGGLFENNYNSTRVVVVTVVTVFWMAAVARQTWFDAAAHCALGLYFFALGGEVHVVYVK